jgi:tRNA-specific 2-thiouridylase
MTLLPIASIESSSDAMSWLRDQSAARIEIVSAETVAIALSGGVDSAVAGMLLLEQGYEVIGLTLRLWQDAPSGVGPDRLSDPPAQARLIAHALGIPFHVVDAASPFQACVVQRFVAEYRAGRTPNPCLYCNRHIKFGYLLQQALQLGTRRLATGHYARVRRSPDGPGWQLLKGVDPDKDQSYFLYVLGQRQLGRVLFPLGSWTKERVKSLAQSRQLPVARHESQDLCFLPDNDYRRFLRAQAPEAFAPGPILNTQGEQIGEHRGLVEYTIGQRSGIGIPAREALYVLHLDVPTNALIVGLRDELGRKEFVAREVNWIQGSPPDQPVQAEIKIRYRALPVQALVTPLSDQAVQVEVVRSLRDVTPGQGVVFYSGELVIGGGLIAGEP